MSKKNNETSLTHLTKRFVRLLNANSDRVVNLNEASTRLSVAKRRIYDITNVLEGIGLLQKISKNVTRWVDCPRDSAFAAPPNTNNSTTPNSNTNHNPSKTTTTTTNNTTATTNHSSGDQLVDSKATTTPGINLNGLPDAELLALLKTYQKLEEDVTDLESSIRQQLSVEGAYVSYHDIKSSFNDQTVIAVKAPPETRLEVNEHLQIAIKSEHGQIEVYLYQHSNNSTTNNNSQNNATQQQLQNVYQTNTTNNSLDATFTNTSNLIGQQNSQRYTSVSSDEGRGRSTTTTDDPYHDPTSESEPYYNDPTLSSALSGTISEDEDPFKPLVPYEAREQEPQYNFVLDENYTITSLWPEDNLGLY